MRILITGGAGFIGSFIVDKLISDGHSVRIFDNLEPQVHQGKIPDYLNKEAEFVKGDVLDYDVLAEAVKDIDVIFHEAAMVGVGQSMYHIRRYVNANTLGTANLLDILVNKNHDVKKLIVAASMSSYGEGLYSCENCGNVEPSLREEMQFERKEWELKCKCGKILKPIPTPETKFQDCNSIYAYTKKYQEEMVMNIGKTYGIPVTALRYFNVFGPRQSLSNPYTGVIAIFMSRLMNDNAPLIFEDGNQTRDFISVHDIVTANLMCMKSRSADYEIFNVGNGKATSVKQIAETLGKLLNKDISPNITERFRKGDVRHCIGDISKIKNKLGFEPDVSLEKGMKELIEWSSGQESVDMVENATKELEEKGLLK